MARKAGISLPVQAGIMPIVSKRQIERTVALSSASLPPQFTKMISRYDHDEQALFDAGIEYAVTQIRLSPIHILVEYGMVSMTF